MLTLNITKEQLIELLGEDLAIQLLDHVTEQTETDVSEKVDKETYDTLAVQYAELKTKYIDRFFGGREEKETEEPPVTEEKDDEEIVVADLFETVEK